MDNDVVRFFQTRQSAIDKLLAPEEDVVPEIAQRRKRIAELSDAATSTLHRQMDIERDPAQRRILYLASVIKRLRAFNNRRRNHPIEKWLAYDAAPEELGRIGDALKLEDAHSYR